MSWELLVKIDIIDIVRVDGKWGTTKITKGSALLVVDAGVTFVSAIFRFRDVVADANGDSLDVAPESHHLGTEVNFEIDSWTGKVLGLGKDDITLSVEFKVFFLPGTDCVGRKKERVIFSGESIHCEL